jgi:hypothetical protein
VFVQGGAREGATEAHILDRPQFHFRLLFFVWAWKRISLLMILYLATVNSCCCWFGGVFNMIGSSDEYMNMIRMFNFNIGVAYVQWQLAEHVWERQIQQLNQSLRPAKDILESNGQDSPLLNKDWGETYDIITEVFERCRGAQWHCIACVYEWAGMINELVRQQRHVGDRSTFVPYLKLTAGSAEDTQAKANIEHLALCLMHWTKGKKPGNTNNREKKNGDAAEEKTDAQVHPGVESNKLAKNESGAGGSDGKDKKKAKKKDVEVVASTAAQSDKKKKAEQAPEGKKAEQEKDQKTCQDKAAKEQRTAGRGANVQHVRASEQARRWIVQQAEEDAKKRQLEEAAQRKAEVGAETKKRRLRVSALVQLREEKKLRVEQQRLLHIKQQAQEKKKREEKEAEDELAQQAARKAAEQEREQRVQQQRRQQQQQQQQQQRQRQQQQEAKQAERKRELERRQKQRQQQLEAQQKQRELQLQQQQQQEARQAERERERERRQLRRRQQKQQQEQEQQRRQLEKEARRRDDEAKLEEVAEEGRRQVQLRAERLAEQNQRRLELAEQNQRDEEELIRRVMAISMAEAVDAEALEMASLVEVSAGSGGGGGEGKYEDGDGGGGCGEEDGNAAQFAANEALSGTTSSFDMDLYNTKLDRSKISDEMAAYADKLAAEIEAEAEVIVFTGEGKSAWLAACTEEGKSTTATVGHGASTPNLAGDSFMDDLMTMSSAARPAPTFMNADGDVCRAAMVMAAGENIPAAAIIGGTLKHDSKHGGAADESTDDDDCVVCMDALRTHLFVPCGHMCVCGDCAMIVSGEGGTNECPLCRVAVSGTVKVFR